MAMFMGFIKKWLTKGMTEDAGSGNLPEMSFTGGNY